MNSMENYNQILQEHTLMALATSVNNEPNVRIVNYFENPEQPGTLYMRTKRDKQKVSELEKNPRVALTTLTRNKYAYIRIPQAVVEPVSIEQEEVQEAFKRRDPSLLETIRQSDGDVLVYALRFEEASITVNPKDPAQVVHFNEGVQFKKNERSH